MIFSELYSAYYNTVACVLKTAVKHPLNKNELRSIIEKNAFGESILNIEPAFAEERWQLIRSDGSTPLVHSPSMPMTTLEKQWLKAIYADPRIRLFVDDEDVLSDVKPLFTASDYSVFDKYSDGDPYEDDTYKETFRLILDAIENRYPLSIDTTNRKGNITHMVLMPEYLEYSEKDDKFRLMVSGCRYGGTVNLARIVSCKPYTKPYEINPGKTVQPKTRTVEFELVDKRNALERILLHFAHFKKQAERIDADRYRVIISYDKDDETEMVIRILSFGPMIRVTAPQHFVELIKERLINQKSCEH
ncbi:MAG: WYL domain-containing protein [Clostridia bacterium]|nr:WYL domain-containing protein [Clostridia bacterium]